MDPNNPVVQLCVAGMTAEAEGSPKEALRLFRQAWDQSKDDYEACIAAHYVARHQATLEETIRWNQISLERALALDDDRVAAFYPSLYLNLGKSYEDLGDALEAAKYYELAAEKMPAHATGHYETTVREAIHRALRRVR